MATSKVSNEVLELQAKMNANAIMVVGSIALINNGAAGDNRISFIHPFFH